MAHPSKVPGNDGKIYIAPLVSVSASVGAKEDRLIHPHSLAEVLNRSPD